MGLLHDGVEPDMLTWGKGMGGDMPNAGLSIRRDLAEQITESSQPNTFAGNAVTAATTITNIDILSENNFELVKRAGELGEQIRGWLTEGAKDTRTIGDVRGRGLMIGIEVVADKETKEPYPVKDRMGHRVIMEARKRGLIIRPLTDVVVLMPPLAISIEELDRLCDITYESIRAVTG